MICITTVHIGRKVKQLRLSKNLSLTDLSKRSGLSKSHISQIENERISPSVAAIVKLSNALGVPLSSFFEEGEEAGNKYIVKQHERKKFTVEGSGVVYELLSSDLKDKIMEAAVIKFAKGAGSNGQLYSYEGEQVGLLLKGKLEINLNGQKFIMEEGDSIYFKSSIPHSGRNIADGESVAVWVITPPNF